MNNFAIKLVPAGWNDLDAIQFTEQQFEQWKNDLNNDTRLLLFEEDATNAIVAEVEIAADFNNIRITPEAIAVPPGVSQVGQSGMGSAPGAAAGGYVIDFQKGDAPDSGVYTIPVNHLHKRADMKQIPLERVRQITGIHDFPRVGEVFLPLDETTYGKILAEWR